MSKKNRYDEELKRGRKSPYEDMQEEEQDTDYEDDLISSDAYEAELGDAFDDEGLDDDELEETGFFSSLKGKLLLGVVVVLLAVLLALVVFMIVGSRKGDEALPGSSPAQEQEAEPQYTQAPASIVFGPSSVTTDEPIVQDEPEEIQMTEVPVISVSETPSPMPTAKPTPAPTAEPTQTPLPIIMSNTPTPSPTPTATPTPSPSPSPTPSPKPTATPQVDIAEGATNRDAKLRESASSSGKIKQTVKKGETVTIHEAVLDKQGKVWYVLTVDDQSIDGFMRDYVITLSEDSELVAPTPTPKATAEPSDEMTVSVDDAVQPEQEVKADVIATGKTNRDANMRKVMNGKVLSTLRKGKAIEILAVHADKNGHIWYEVRQPGSDTIGFMRDYVVTVSGGTKLELPEPTAAPKEEIEEKPEQDSEAQSEEAPEVEPVVNVIGKAKTNRDANVREKPVSGAKLVRQISKGNALNIYAKYSTDDQIWYEVATESGKTRGYVRDYVINIQNIDKDVEAQTYVEKTETEAEEAEDEVEKSSEAASSARESRFKYAGNKESKVFHEIYCDLLPATSKNLVYMESRSYAVNTGYKPCEVCAP